MIELNKFKKMLIKKCGSKIIDDHWRTLKNYHLQWCTGCKSLRIAHDSPKSPNAAGDANHNSPCTGTAELKYQYICRAVIGQIVVMYCPLPAV